MSTDQRLRSRRTILDAIRQGGPVARIDLARATGLSQATVTTITADMLRDGLIEEVARDSGPDARRGRPRVGLKLRGAAHRVAGVKVAHSSLSVALMDFEGELIGEHHHDLSRTVLPPEEMVATLRKTLATACERAGLPAGALSGVGVGIAGIVDATGGQVHWSPSLDQRNVALRDMAARALGVPVFIDNDANLVAMAEQYFGHGRNVSDFIVVTVESGVGMGIVLGGRLYRGTRGCGAEFGHTKVQLDGALCRCGQRGCLEAYVADYALMREAQVLGGSIDSVEALMTAARGGDAGARSIVSRASRMFAMGLANLINIFDPQLIILSGERAMMDHLYDAEVTASVRRSIVQIDLPPPEVVVHKWDDLMWARGAAAFAIDGVADLALGAPAEDVA